MVEWRKLGGSELLVGVYWSVDIPLFGCSHPTNEKKTYKASGVGFSKRR